MNNSVLTCIVGMLLSAYVLTGCGRAKRAGSPSPTERTLFSFERSTMLAIYDGTASRTLVPEHATHGRRALRARFSPKHETLILSSGGFPMDWRGWHTLKADVYREGAPLSLNLRFTDAHGRRHWIWSVPLAPGANTLTIDLSSLQGYIDLSAVAEIMCYAEQPSGAIDLDNVRLSR
ncbi:MAG: hypothetical protein ACUVSE_00335 [Armatimonadota bacterium]